LALKKRILPGRGSHTHCIQPETAGKSIVVLFLLCFSSLLMCAGVKPDSALAIPVFKTDTLQLITAAPESCNNSRPNPILQLVKIKQRKNKRITAAILAFPFPFGIVGLHRIYLGTSPHVPVVYIGSLGGVFGILPFIDFCVLVLDKDLDRYTENKKVFMWVN
jgi:TM2 domain-containing membrane protein YozV